MQKDVHESEDSNELGLWIGVIKSCNKKISKQNVGEIGQKCRITVRD